MLPLGPASQASSQSVANLGPTMLQLIWDSRTVFASNVWSTMSLVSGPWKFGETANGEGTGGAGAGEPGRNKLDMSCAAIAGVMPKTGYSSLLHMRKPPAR